MRKNDNARNAYYLLCDAVKAGLGTEKGKRLGWDADSLMIEPGADDVLLLPAEEAGEHGRYGLSVQQVYTVDDEDGWHDETGRNTIYWLGRKDNGVFKSPW